MTLLASLMALSACRPAATGQDQRSRTTSQALDSQMFRWEQLSTSANPPTLSGTPGKRSNNQMVDLGGGKLLMFGGQYNGQGNQNADTWELDTGATPPAWAKLSPTKSPAARYNYASARVEDGVALLFGGTNGSNVGGTFSDTWLWNDATTTWTSVTNYLSTGQKADPAYRAGSMMEPLGTNQFLVFGGTLNSGAATDDTYIVTLDRSGATPKATWSLQKKVTGNWPQARWSSAMKNLGDGTILMAGGWSASGGNPVSDIWKWVGGTWVKQAATFPGAGLGHAAITTIEPGKALIFGGAATAGSNWSNFPTNILYQWDGTGLTALTPVAGSPVPPARYYFAMGPFSKGGLVLYGGIGGSLSDTWVLKAAVSVTLNSDTNGTVRCTPTGSTTPVYTSPSTITLDPGTSLSCQSLPNSGYNPNSPACTGAACDSTGTDTFTVGGDTGITAPATVTPQFTLPGQNIINVTPTTGGTVTCSPTAYVPNDATFQSTCAVVVNPGYIMDGLDCSACSGNSCPTNISDSAPFTGASFPLATAGLLDTCTITPKFRRAYNVTDVQADASGNGIVCTPKANLADKADAADATIAPKASLCTLSLGAGYRVTPGTFYCTGTVDGCLQPNANGDTFTLANFQSDVSIFAKFDTAITVTGTVDPASTGMGGISPPTQTKSAGDIAYVVVSPTAGNEITGVTGDGVTCSSPFPSLVSVVCFTSPLTQDVDIVATFAPVPVDAPITVTASASGSGTLTPPTQSHAKNDLAYVIATPLANSQVTSVTAVDADNNPVVLSCTVNPPTTASITCFTPPLAKDVTITATFEPTTPALTVTGLPTTGGTVTPPTRGWNTGDLALVTVTPTSGFQTTGVTGVAKDGSGVPMFCSTPFPSTAAMTCFTSPLSQDVTVTGTFELIASPIVVTGVVGTGNGGITPPSQIHAAGDLASVTATPDSGYRLASVVSSDPMLGVTCSATLPATISTTCYTTALSRNVTLTANFEKIPVTAIIVTGLVGTGTGTIGPSSQTRSTNDLAFVSVSPGTGFQITSVASSDPGVTVTCSPALPTAASAVCFTSALSKDVTLTANFEAISPVLPITLTVTSTDTSKGAVAPASQVISSSQIGQFYIMPAANQMWTSIEVTQGTGVSVDCTLFNSEARSYLCIASGITANTSVQVSFDALVSTAHKVTAQMVAADAGQALLSPVLQRVDNGQVATVILTPVDGKEFQAVTTDAGATTTCVLMNAVDRSQLCTVTGITVDTVVTFALQPAAAPVPTQLTFSQYVTGSGSVTCQYLDPADGTTQKSTSLAEESVSVLAKGRVACLLTPDEGYAVASANDTTYAPTDVMPFLSNGTYMIDSMLIDHVLRVSFKLANGQPATGGTDCASGNFAAGEQLCCDTACAGACNTCATGTCAVKPSGDACGTATGVCAGSCDGQHADCAYPGAETILAPQTCVASVQGASVTGVVTVAKVCDGQGNATTPKTISCPNGCDGDTCANPACKADSDCASGYWCAAGVCAPKKQPAAHNTCSSDGECVGGNCIDGFCCNTRCSDSCATCNATGSEGTCVPLASGATPHADRTPCVNVGIECGGTCSGSLTCTYPTTVCGGTAGAAHCENDGVVMASQCQAGVCVPGEAESCGRYGCSSNNGGVKCLSGCDDQNPCASGFYCLDGKCLSDTEFKAQPGVRGTGCSTSGTSASLFAVLLVAGCLLLRSSKRKAAVLGVVLSGVAFGATAHAQVPYQREFEVQRFQPSFQAKDILGVGSASMPDSLTLNLNALANYAYKPLRYMGTHPATTLVGNQSAVDVAASIGLGEHFELSAVLPVTVNMSGHSLSGISPTLGGTFDSAGIGGIRLIPKANFWSPGDFRFALAAPISVPFGKNPYLGGSTTFEPRLEADYVGLPVRLVGNVGFISRKRADLVDLTVGNAATFGLGAELPFSLAGQNLALQGTFTGEKGIEKSGVQEMPLEAIGALKWMGASGLNATVGAGAGLNDGYGAPGFRVLAGLGYTAKLGRRASAAMALRDQADSLQGEQEEAISLPVLSKAWGAPSDTLRVTRVENGAHGQVAILPDGRISYLPEKGFTGKDRFSYTVRSGDDQVGEGHVDVDVLPLADRDHDGVPDRDDRCPDQPGPISNQGCPEMARIEGNKIVILEPVYFATDEDVILPRSDEVLRSVTGILKAHPEIERVRVEGHTDNTAPAAYNKDLSNRRAQSVRQYLINAGVEASRLDAVGYGLTRPIVSNDTDAGRAKNRRVEFLIVDAK